MMYTLNKMIMINPTRSVDIGVIHSNACVTTTLSVKLCHNALIGIANNQNGSVIESFLFFK